MSTSTLRVCLAACLLLLPSCFLPDWDDRDWVNNQPPGDDDDDDNNSGDDDTSAGDDDDTTDDDDDAATTEIPFSGLADLDLTLYGYPADCQVPIDAELDTEQSELDGDGECLVWGYITVGMEIQCDLVGTTFDGLVLVFDEDGYIQTSLNIPVHGVYDELDGSIILAGSGSFSGIHGDVTINLDAD